MSDWPVGLSTGCFFQKSIFDCLETISRGGFNIIEICSFPAHLDYHDELPRSGFSITNPNAKSTCGCGSSFSM